MNPEDSLRQVLSNTDSLPAIPNIARKILAMKLNTDEDDKALLEIIVQDPPIMSKIVGLSNSPLFNPGRKVTKLSHAVKLLGIKRVKMIALSFSMISSTTKKPASRLNIQSLWKHSLAIAMAMEIIARHMPRDRCPPDDEIYLAGLLHHIGLLLLDYVDPQLSDEFQARLAIEANSSMQEVEAEMLGIGLGEMGAILGRYWNLPECIIASMNYPHPAENDQSANGKTLGFLANLAEMILPPIGFTESSLKDITKENLQYLGIEPVYADVIKSKIKGIILEVAAINF